MARLIDASILIAHERGTIDLRAQLQARQVTNAALSVITASEMLHGVSRAADPQIQFHRSLFVEQLLIEFPIVGIDVQTARVHANLWAELERAGTPIGRHDTWLAATCLQHGMAMVTANEREFRRVPGLIVENWLTP